MIFRASIDAFTLTPAFAEAVTRLKADPAFATARIERRDGGIAAAVTSYADRTSPQLVIVEEDDDDAALVARLEQLAECCDGATRVIVVGKINDIHLYRSLIARGVSDYLVAPVGPAQLADSIIQLLSDPGAARRGRIVAFWGARGGVGASTLAQNVADALGGLLAEPALYLDLDLGFGTSLLAFNMELRQTVLDALAQPERLDPLLLDRLLTAHGERVRVLASPADPRQSLIATLDGIDRLIDMAARMAPAIVVDLPRLWCDWSDHVLAGADEIVLVAQPDLASLREAKRFLELVAPRRVEGAAAPRLVVNKQDCYRKTQLSPKDFAETLGIQPALVLPFEPVLFGEAANNGQMLSEAAKGHKVVQQIASFAERLAGQGVARKSRAKANPLLRLLAR